MIWHQTLFHSLLWNKRWRLIKQKCWLHEAARFTCISRRWERFNAHCSRHLVRRRMDQRGVILRFVFKPNSGPITQVIRCSLNMLLCSNSNSHHYNKQYRPKLISEFPTKYPPKQNSRTFRVLCMSYRVEFSDQGSSQPTVCTKQFMNRQLFINQQVKSASWVIPKIISLFL